jgi:hypothetical protein
LLLLFREGEDADILPKKKNMHNAKSIKTFDVHSGISVSFIGPDLYAGPLPALFYFALAAHESLCVDPYNQPAIYLSSLPMRIFSIDLPGHGPHLPSKEALKFWAEEFSRGNNVVAQCAELASTIIGDLITKNILVKEKCAVAGLSRGVLIAAHVAARCKEIRWILGFAPLTKVSHSKDFQQIPDHPMIHDVNMENLASLLTERFVRFYIGNCDQRVGTRNCFDFIEKLSQEIYTLHTRSPLVELFINPSIGFEGHGTSKQIFHHGAQWIAEQLGVINAC